MPGTRFATFRVGQLKNRNLIMEALLFGESMEVLDAVSHDNVALFEQYEPLAAMNDEVTDMTSADSDDCALDNLYLVPNW